MSRDSEQSIWWKELTADDACSTEAKLNDLIRSPVPVDTDRVSQLWYLLYTLGKHEEMKGLLKAINEDMPKVTKENINAVKDWLGKYQPVLRVLNGLQETLSKYPGNYNSLAACVNPLIYQARILKLKILKSPSSPFRHDL